MSIPSSHISPKPPFCEYQAHLSINDCVFYFSDGNFFTYTRNEPIGVCGQIIPVSCSYIIFSQKKVSSNPISFVNEDFLGTNECLAIC